MEAMPSRRTYPQSHPDDGHRIADNYKIKKGKIRGLESLGMICSLGELGISDSVVPKEFADGIQILPDDAVPGEEVFSSKRM